MKPYKHPDTIDFYIKDIYNKMRFRVDSENKKYNVTHPQGKLLGIIYSSNKHGIQINRRILEEKTGVSGPSVTSLLNSLEKKGFIKRSMSDEDGRALNISVTKEGEALVEKVHSVFRKSEAKLVKGMSSEEKKTFKELLRKAHSNILDD